MKNFVKENWFKLGILLVLVIIAIPISQYVISKKNTEQEKKLLSEQKQIKDDIKSQQLSQKQEWVDNCIKDAYVELKTLQDNFLQAVIAFPGLGIDLAKKSQAEAYKRYEEEWVPQCKLGNRVFIDYKYCSSKDIMNDSCPE